MNSATANQENTARNIEQVKALEALRITAAVNSDVDALGTLLSDDFIWVHANGNADTKAQWLEKIRCLAVRYLSMLVEESTYRAFGDVVLVNGKGSTTFVNKAGEKTIHMRFAAVYAKTPQDWKLVSMQVTPIQPL